MQNHASSLLNKGYEVVIAYKNGSMMKETLRENDGSVRRYLSIELFTSEED